VLEKSEKKWITMKKKRRNYIMIERVKVEGEKSYERKVKKIGNRISK